MLEVRLPVTNRRTGINNVTKEEIKSGILLTHLTDETYRLVRYLAYPKTVESLTYYELVQILNSHFKPKQCSFVDKATFFGATRSPGESLGDWAARLRGLASYCEFGDALETNLKDRFVLGLGSGPERDKLFEQNPTTLTLTKAIEIGEQAACAREVRVMLNTSDFGLIKEEPVYRAKIHQFARGSGGDGTLLRHDTPWEWGERQRRSMAAVRRELASERVLVHFEPTAQLVLQSSVIDHVEQPVNTDAIDHDNGEEWGDYSAQDSVGDSTEIPEASDSPEASENGVEQPQSDSVRSNDVPPAQAPTPARQLRPRKRIDYKKYFK
ncbi:unnamed protein product [Parnassius apollo]|uniref:(apollo) hypothetical protein n=1 Tax=Parnassius apollo TaxID=110799 RepID=A0A8S3Y9P3_PARAO|nr:unnamed protein product [Parnassius apollo]